MIENNDLEELAGKYENIIRQINALGNLYCTQNNQMELCRQFIFSDSIILIANADTDSAFVDLITYAWRFLQLSIAMKMPVRGGISYGDIYMNENSNIFFGEGLTDAQKLESNQEWIGVAIDNNAEEKYKGIFENSEYRVILQKLLLDYNVPLKMVIEKG